MKQRENGTVSQIYIKKCEKLNDEHAADALQVTIIIIGSFLNENRIQHYTTDIQIKLGWSNFEQKKKTSNNVTSRRR